MSLVKLRLPKMRLRSINNFLSVVVALLAIYIIAAPYAPQLTWWLQHDSPVSAVTHPTASNPTVPAPVVQQDTVQGNALFIPRLDMKQAIYGGSKSSLSKGIWRLPHTSTPDKGGNTVLVGHRFTYAGPAVLYHLDKVQKGDAITVRWQDKTYEYKVSDIRIVLPTDMWVEAPTDNPQLTIYTCTPLWSVKNRLVIIAKPLEAGQ
jgi:sortase A